MYVEIIAIAVIGAVLLFIGGLVVGDAQGKQETCQQYATLVQQGKIAAEVFEQGPCKITLTGEVR